ncbi:L-2,4-diaminobutyrate decarboxylase [Nocardioides salarius]|uniref:L-2,4-diaminobutyrate decarboxylase n=1 Tax=Nocardioides salarius TaxID=374513 RepID=A0ABS2M6Y7_9ACTN|nr:aspartate aminotransferase family protein [Nocardioides salarius]MBM7506954.1 L-2,4-diaminobutyrate decarboxylase [Nocardioides salarius]
MHPSPHDLSSLSSTRRQLLHPQHATAYADAAHLAIDHVTNALGRVRGPVTGLDPARAAAPVHEVDLDAPLGCTAQALSELDRVWLDDTVWFHEPGYAAHLNCPVLIPALVAEAVLSAVNPSLDTFDQNVGATFVERHLVDWVAARAGLGPRADGVFTSGGTQSNLQGLHLARDQVRSRRPGTDLARLRVLTSVDAHVSVERATRLLGLAPDAVRTVAVDERRRMRPDALARALAEVQAQGATTMAVVATAGTTDHGSIDPLGPVAGLARAHGAWLHVDAAYGGGLLVSRRHRHLLDGIELADSVTVDFHKTWFQPVSCSAVLVRERDHLRHVTFRADYLNPADGGGATRAPNQVDKSLQTTRRFDALKLWMTLRVMGADAIGEHVDAVVDLARSVHARLEADPRIEVAAAPELSTLLVRPVVPGLDAAQQDALVPRVRAALWSGGRSVVAATVVDGRRWLKLTLLNPLATPEDIEAVVADVVEAARTVVAEQAA